MTNSFRFRLRELVISKRSLGKRRGGSRTRRAEFEHLEPRTLLDGSGLADYDTVSPEWFASAQGAWVRSNNYVVAAAGEAADASGTLDAGHVAVGRWIVRLTPEATAAAGSVRRAETLLDEVAVDFRVLRGLGLPGQLLVETESPVGQVRAVLSANTNVASFSPDGVVTAQTDAILPNDSYFSSLTGPHNVGQFGATPDADIDAPEAWSINTGSSSVVVGVIDSGIDVTHPDLYLNIWLNHGEIPAALKSQLRDLDGDGRITFYDLNSDDQEGRLQVVPYHANHSVNASLVHDLNGNDRIDAEDLLADPRWADGVDTDHNQFIDDFFGWNFRRSTDEPFQANDPADALGHGTHVAGTIGAVGNNGTGVTGINWRSSLMSLKFLDNSNQGLTSDAAAALNYATMMRTGFGEKVRVLNASWGQSGGFDAAVRGEIEKAGQAGILFVAAAGNGNVLGEGINLDREPFYPASYDVESILAVAATGPNDELARFSNFGAATVDLAAPGIGVLSTLPGGRYGTANGTSMAAPHVAGVAALLWSEEPDATPAEVREAILSSVDRATELNGSSMDPKAELSGRTVTGGRLNAMKALNSDKFAPRAKLVSAADITVADGVDNLITVRYSSRQGIDITSLDDHDLVVTRRWGPKDLLPVTLVRDLVTPNPEGTEVTATYSMTAPGGAWDALDFGGYRINVVDRQVRGQNKLFAPSESIGEFSVRIDEDEDPTVFYVDTFIDGADANVGDGIAKDANGNRTLRAAIQEANAATPAARTIILVTGTYKLSLPPVPDAAVPFPTSVRGGSPPGSSAPWSNETTGDLDVLGNFTIVGDDARTSMIDAGGLDRVLKVYPGAALVLRRIGITGGVAPDGQDGGGILTVGTLEVDTSRVANNSASGAGGGIAVWGGHTQILASTIADNKASGNGGGGLFVCNDATLDVYGSTVARNDAPGGGGGISSYGAQTNVTNSTISGNDSGTGPGAAVHVLLNGNGPSRSSSLSADGRFVAFVSNASNLVPDDTNGSDDIFVYDRQGQTLQRVSVASDGTEANGHSSAPSLSADGRFVVFESDASNLVPDDRNEMKDVFVYDCQERTVQRVSVAIDATEGDLWSYSPSLSADGRYVAFASFASNLVPGDTNWNSDIFVYDRQEQSIERVDAASPVWEPGSWAYYTHWPSLSADGRFIAFESGAPNLVPGDTNGESGIFLYDRQQQKLRRVSVAPTGNEANGGSHAASLSADGQFVVFESDASNLVPDDTNELTDIFVYDVQKGAIERVSVASDGRQASGWSLSPSLSADGRFVAFRSLAWDLVPLDMNQAGDVFVYDRVERKIERLCAASDGTSLSADGRFVAFEFLTPQSVFVFDREKHALETNIFSAASPVFLESVTLAENTGGGTVSGLVVTHNSLFARNTDTAFTSPSTVTVSTGYNLVSSADAFAAALATDQVTANSRVQLGPLQDNGGPTWTHALLSGSAGVDAADPAEYPRADQRGIIPRPQDGDGTQGAQPDIGAFETYYAQVSGTVFQDLDRDGTRDPNEPGLPKQTLFVDANESGSYDEGEPVVQTQADDPLTTSVIEQGAFTLGPLAPGTYRIAPLPGPAWSATVGAERVSVASDGAESNAASSLSVLSADGRFVAFESSSALVPGSPERTRSIFVYDRQVRTVERVATVDQISDGPDSCFGGCRPALSADGRFVAFASAASDLVPGDTNEMWDIFVYDRQTRTFQRVSVSSEGVQSNSDCWSPSISGDGRFVAFTSYATSLVPGDTYGTSNVFVYDRQNDSVRQVSIASDGTEGDASSDEPSLSADGRFVAFSSEASNLVPGDSNGITDVFVYDLLEQTIRRVSLAGDGTEGNGASYSPSLSADGRFVAFVSDATNLVPGDTNEKKDVFVYDIQEQAIRRVSVARDGTEGDWHSYSPSLSAEGRFVAFDSDASNLVPEDANGTSDVFVYDLRENAIERVSVAGNGAEGDDGSYSPALSADGRLVAFTSAATNLAAGDTNGEDDVFVEVNPAAPGAGARSVSLFAGQVLRAIDFGLMPDPGEIRGRCFQDAIANGVYDAGEPGQPGWTVFLDANANGRLDDGELATPTDADGNYAFPDLPAAQDYRVALVLPDGYTTVLPAADTHGVWDVYLPAGRTVSDRDFGVRPLQTTGQSEDASLQGFVFVDRNGNGRQDAGEPGMAGATLLLDLNDDGVWQFNEPRTVSADDGSYSFSHLGNRPYTIRVLNLSQQRQTAPVGNRFVSQTQSLALAGSAVGRPEDVAVADFDGDGLLDLAAAMWDRAAVALLLNDGQGGFLQPPVEISLAPAGRPANQVIGTGPLSLLAVDVDHSGQADLVVVNATSDNVAIWRNFRGGRFEAETYVSVGDYPTAVTSGDYDGDLDVDLVVANADSGTVTVLRNDGPGKFTRVLDFPVGQRPFGIVAGRFNGDDDLDLAIADVGRDADWGDVRILLSDGKGSFTNLAPAPQVGFRPAAIAAADLNGDGILDLAVANFSSNTLTICLGAGDGSFVPDRTLPTGAGPLDVATADIDGDGDIDLLVGNFSAKNAIILRNRLSQGEFGFEPAETFGAISFPIQAKFSLATGDFDRNGTTDVAVVSSSENRVQIFANSLVGGAYRRALTGVGTVTGLDFGLQPINAPPTLSSISNPPAIYEDAGEQTIAIGGITAGAAESQPLRVTATSNQPTLIPDPLVEYTSPNASGSLRYTPGPDQFGTALVTVTVTDGGLDGDLDTSGDNGSVARSFTVTVLPLNDPPTLDAPPSLLNVLEDAPQQHVNLTGITAGGAEVQPLQVTATTTHPQLITDMVVTYNGADPNAALSFRLPSDASGTALVTVTVMDGGLDNDLTTAGDNLATVRAMAVVVRAVNDPPTHPWQNPVLVADVDGDGEIGPNDALIIINYLNSVGAGPLPIPPPGAGGPPPYLDPSGDDGIGPVDTLMIINYLNKRAGGEGEWERSAKRIPDTSQAQVILGSGAMSTEDTDWDHLLGLLAENLAIFGNLSALRRQ